MQPIIIMALVGISLCVIMGTGMIISTIYFFKYRRFRFFSARRPPLLGATAAFGIFLVLVREPFALLHHSRILVMPNNYALTVSWVIGMHMFLLCITLRFWVTFFNYKHSESLKNMEWRTAINPQDQDFFIASSRTWGSALWVTIRGLVVEILCFLVLLIVADVVGSKEAWYCINLVFMGGTAGLALHFYHRLSQVEFTDSFFMRQELRQVKTVVVSNAALYLLSNGLYTFFFVTIDELAVLTSVISAEMVTVTWLYSTWFVINLHQQTSSSTPSPDRPGLKASGRSESDRPGTKYLRQHELLLYIEGQNEFDAFMHHLVSEFSLESLLFIVELMQYKALFPSTTSEEDEELRAQVDEINARIIRDRMSYIGLIDNGSNQSHTRGNSARNSPRPSTSDQRAPIRREKILPQDLLSIQQRNSSLKDMENSDRAEPELRVRLPARLPVSPLQSLEDVFERGQYLYHKYIAPESILELNIPWDMRKQLGNFFGDRSIIESSSPSNQKNAETDLTEESPYGDLAYLRLVFDDAAREVVNLMLDAFERFQFSDEFYVEPDQLANSMDDLVERDLDELDEVFDKQGLVQQISNSSKLGATSYTSRTHLDVNVS